MKPTTLPGLCVAFLAPGQHSLASNSLLVYHQADYCQSSPQYELASLHRLAFLMAVAVETAIAALLMAVFELELLVLKLATLACFLVLRQHELRSFSVLHLLQRPIDSRRRASTYLVHGAVLEARVSWMIHKHMTVEFEFLVKRDLIQHPSWLLVVVTLF